MPWSNSLFSPIRPMDGFNLNAASHLNPVEPGNSFDFGNFFNQHGRNLLGVAGLAGNAFMGMQQYGMARQALRQSQDQFNKNFAAQRQTLNTAMEDRQRARVASNPGAYESVGEYMERNRI